MNLDLDLLKQQARRLRDGLALAGNEIGHGQALELVARQNGYRDWNTLHAALGHAGPRPPAALGDHVEGHYLGQRFSAKVVGIEAQMTPGRWRMTFLFDKPVDVVTFDSFSAFRSRITVNLNANGRTTEKTSNGKPHLALDL